MKNIITVILFALLAAAASADSLPLGSTPGTLGYQTNALNGAGITNILDAALSTNVAKLNAIQTFSASNTFPATNEFNTNDVAGTFTVFTFGKDPTVAHNGSPFRMYWDGGNSELRFDDGTTSKLNLHTGTITSDNNIVASGSIQASVVTGFNGDGFSVIHLQAGNISGGTLADARLSGNVDLLNGAQTITGAKVLSGGLGVTNTVNGSGTAFLFGVPTIYSNNVAVAGISTNGHVTAQLSGTNLLSIHAPGNTNSGIQFDSNATNDIVLTVVGQPTLRATAGGVMVTKLTATNGIVDKGPTTNLLLTIGNDNGLTNIPSGSAGQILVYDATQLGGSKWSNFPAGGPGTVSSVSGPSIITWANSTTTPTGTLNNQTSNTFLAGPTSGSAAAPGFRPMTEADIPAGLAPAFNGTNITNLTTTNLTGLTTNGMSVVYTNVVLGTIYTNNFGTPMAVQGVSVVFTEASVAGRSTLLMSMTNSGVVSNTTVSQVTAIGIATGSDTNAFTSFMVTNGGTFSFTDQSSGAGNSVTVTGGQFAYVQQLSIANTFQGGGSGLTNLSANAPGESNIVTWTSGTNAYPDLSGKMRVPINITNNILFTYPTNGPGICEYQVFGLGGTNTFVLLFPTNVISPLQSNMFTGYGTNWGIVISNGWKINFEDKRGVANGNGSNWFATLIPL